MPKIKTRQAVSKRFKITKNKKVIKRTPDKTTSTPEKPETPNATSAEMVLLTKPMPETSARCFHIIRKCHPDESQDLV